MELTIIGKNGPYPGKTAAASSFLLQSGDKNIIIDMGSGTLSKLLEFISFSQIDAIILSHLHFDHFCDILPLSYYFLSINKRIKVYCPASPSKELELLNSCKIFDIEIINEEKLFDIGDIAFTFKKMTHPIESYAIKCAQNNKFFVYSGDTTFNDAIIPFISGAKLALLDCGNYSDNPHSPHLSLSQAYEISQYAGVRVVAVHLNPFGQYNNSYSGVDLAETGKKYII